MKVDLHVHSSFSDGLLSRKEIINLASQEEVTLLSFTDHNCFENNLHLAFRAEEKGIKLINGVEISSQFHHHEIHIIAYGLEELCPGLEEYFQAYAKQKTKQTQIRCQKSQEDPLILKSGEPISISFEELFRPEKKVYLWNEMTYRLSEKFNQIKRDDAPTMNQYDAKCLLMGIPRAYEKFKDAFVNLEKGKRLWHVHYPIKYLPAGETIYLIQKMGALSCLAHPEEQNLEEKTIVELRQVGLDALEVYTPKNRRISYHRSLAKSLGLLQSGGTDFHYPSSHHSLGRILGDRSKSKPLFSDFHDINEDQLTILGKLF